MKRIRLFIAMVIFSLNGFSQVNVQWAEQAGRTTNYARLAVDSSGNSYMCGTFQDTFSAGSMNVLSAGLTDIFLAKYNSSGVVQWVQAAGGNSNDYGGDICLDASGNIYVTGVCSNSASFGSNIISGGGSYLAKYNSAGVNLWVKRIDTLQGANASFIASGDSGTIFVAGRLYSLSNFPCSTVSSSPSSTQFIARFDSAGNCLSLVTFGATYLMDIDADKDNNVYVTGAFFGTGIFGGNNITSNGSQDIYLAKCNSNGSWAWAISAGGADFDQGLAVDADIYGHVYLTGYFRDTVSFGCASLMSSGAADIFIASYDSSGNCHWVEQAGGGLGNQYGFGITSDNKGSCVITGSIIDTTIFGSYTLIPYGEKSFFAKYDSSGMCQWAIESTGLFGNRGYGLGADTSGNIYASGQLFSYGPHSFGNYTLNALSYNCSLMICYNIYLIKLHSIPTDNQVVVENGKAFSLSPNPATNQLTIDNGELKIKEVEIYNSLGEKCLTPTLSKGEGVRIDVSSLPAGIYFLKVRGEKEERIAKFVKQ